VNGWNIVKKRVTPNGKLAQPANLEGKWVDLKEWTTAIDKKAGTGESNRPSPVSMREKLVTCVTKGFRA